LVLFFVIFGFSLLSHVHKFGKGRNHVGKVDE